MALNPLLPNETKIPNNSNLKFGPDANPKFGPVGVPPEPSLLPPPNKKWGTDEVPPGPSFSSPPNKEWGKGDLQITDDGSFYTPPEKTATVEGRLGGLLERGSPYIEAAKAGAKRQSNERGLLNSTMATTAGEKAGIESALPIAQQDAGYEQQRGLAEQQGEIQGGLAKQQGEIQEGLYETQGNISERLAAAGYEHEAVMQEADLDWKQIDLQSRMDVEYDRMTADNKNKFNELANKISEDFMNDYIEIMLNPNFRTNEDRAAAFNILNENTRKRYEMAGAVSEVELTWPGTPENTEGLKTDIQKQNEESTRKYLEMIKAEQDKKYREGLRESNQPR
jgi:hypothetical protein